MQFTEFQHLVSAPRLAKYRNASKGDTEKAIKLYLGNIRLSQDIYAVLSMFEVVLRNKIDQHYRYIFAATIGSNEWLLHAANPGGYLSVPGCQHSRQSVLDAINELGNNYNHDKLVAQLSFGFWRFQFAAKEFRAAGSNLLQIFTSRPKGVNQTAIFNKLGNINKIRNRIAHHEPICFDPMSNISTIYALSHHNDIIELFSWMGIDNLDLLDGIDNVQDTCKYINGI